MFDLRPIPGFNGYFADAEGNVHSAKRAKTIIRKAQVGNQGYLRLPFLIAGRRMTKSVHRLVASAFLGEAPEGYDVNHKDGNKRNNAPANLEYVTRSANILHSFALGMSKPKRGAQNPRALLTAGQVEEMRKLKDYFTSSELGIVFGLNRSSVSEALRGESYA